MINKTELFVAMQQQWIKLNGVKNGDRVKVVRLPNPNENGWEGTVFPESRLVPGELGTIKDDFTRLMNVGIHIKFDNAGLENFPYFCLELVKEENKTYRLGQRFRHKDGEVYMLCKVFVNGGAHRLVLTCVEVPKKFKFCYIAETWNSGIIYEGLSQVTEIPEERIKQIMGKKEQYDFTLIT